MQRLLGHQRIRHEAITYRFKATLFQHRFLFRFVYMPPYFFANGRFYYNENVLSVHDVLRS